MRYVPCMMYVLQYENVYNYTTCQNFVDMSSIEYILCYYCTTQIVSQFDTGLSCIIGYISSRDIWINPQLKTNI
jgi:hypothetical protein